MGFNTVPYEPYCIMKEGVFIFFYINNIVFIFRKNKIGIIKGIDRKCLCSGRIHYKITLKVCLQDGQVLSSI